MFRYLEKAKKDGRVEAMSMVKTEGHSANVQEIRHDSLERKMISMSKGGSNNQRLLTAQQKKGLVAAPLSGAAAALPSGMRKGLGMNVHQRLLTSGKHKDKKDASSPNTSANSARRNGGGGRGQGGRGGQGAMGRASGGRQERASAQPREMSFIESLNSY